MQLHCRHSNWSITIIQSDFTPNSSNMIITKPSVHSMDQYIYCTYCTYNQTFTRVTILTKMIQAETATGVPFLPSKLHYIMSEVKRKVLARQTQSREPHLDGLKIQAENRKLIHHDPSHCAGSSESSSSGHERSSRPHHRHIGSAHTQNKSNHKYIINLT